MRESMPDLPSSQDIARIARSPVSYLNSLAASNNEGLVPDPGDPADAPLAEESFPHDHGTPAANGHAPPAPTLGAAHRRARHPGPRRPRDELRAGGEPGATRAHGHPAVHARKERPTPDAMTLVAAPGGAPPAADLLRHRLRRRRRRSPLPSTRACSTCSGTRYCQASPHNCGFYVTGPLDPLSLRIQMAAFGGLAARLAGDPLPAVALHHAGPLPQREALRHPLRRLGRSSCSSPAARWPTRCSHTRSSS